MLKLVERGFFKSPPIKLSDSPSGMPADQNPTVQVLRVGQFNHPKYGEFKITPKILSEMKANFDAKIRGVDICFDYFHESDKDAAGWPNELFLAEDGNSLWARVDWTPTARKKLTEREIRYFSPDFAFQWKDPETGKVYNNVLFGGGLTNRPFVKDMAAIVASENKGGIMNEKELLELQAKVLKLAEDQGNLAAENAELKKKLAELQPKPPAAKPEEEAPSEDENDPVVLKKKLADAMEMNEKLLGEKKKAEEAKQMAEKETAFNLLLTEGKACAAQKEAFVKGDMENFIKLAQPVNLSGKGSPVNGGDATGDRDERVLKLAEQKVRETKGLALHEAIAIAHKEIK
jgi:phage I-like protein